MTLKDVKVTFLESADLLQMFSAKMADALFETRHYTEVMVRKKRGRVVLGHQDIIKKLGLIQGQPLITRRTLVEKQPEVVQRFINAWVKALLYIDADPADASRILTIFFHRQGIHSASVELSKTWVSYVRHDRYFWSDRAIADAEYNAWALKEINEIRKIPKLKGYVENRFAQRAIQQVKAEKRPGSLNPQSQPSKK